MMPATEQQPVTEGSGTLRFQRWFMVAIVMMLVVPVVGTCSARAEGEANLEIHRRVCPPGVYTDIYNVCHALAQRPGIVISVSGAERRRVVTDETGNALFDGLTPGLYFAGDNAPGGDFTHRSIFCSEAETPGVYRPAGLSAIMLAAGASVVCDWYITNPDMNSYPDPARTPAPTPAPPPPLPAGTTLTVSSWTCPKNYVDDDYGESCRHHPGAGFRYAAAHVGYLNAPATGPDGILQFDLTGLQTKWVVVSTWPPDGSRQYYASIVDCHAGDARLEVRPLDTLATHTMVAVPVAPGDQIHCDWYNVPYGGS